MSGTVGISQPLSVAIQLIEHVEYVADVISERKLSDCSQESSGVMRSNSPILKTSGLEKHILTYLVPFPLIFTSLTMLLILQLSDHTVNTASTSTVTLPLTLVWSTVNMDKC